MKNIFFISLLLTLVIIISPVLPFKFIPKIFIVLSGSMEPDIKTGSIVITKSINPLNLTAGDIVAYNSPLNSKENILHRIISIKSQNPLIFKTKGDKNNSPDTWDLMSVGVLGKKIFTIPYFGYLIAYIKSPIGFIIFTLIPAIYFIFSQIIYIKKQISLLSIIFIFLIPLIFSKNIYAKFIGNSLISNMSFSIGDLSIPDIPVLISPSNNIYLKSDPFTLSWSDTDASYYIYQSANNINFENPYTSENLSSNFTLTSGTNDYTYYWHVKACNQFDSCSDYSETRIFTIDDTPPISALEDIPYNTNQNTLNLIYWATDNNQVSNTNLCYSFNLGNYQCSPNFNFQFQDGDGLYYFYTQATDIANNIEDKTSFTNSIIYDTIPPTTNLLLNPTIPIFTGQNLINDIGSSFSLNSYTQKILIPHNLSSNLIFSFNYFSEDSDEFSHLNVGVSTAESITNILNFGGIGDFGWQTITHSLLQWAGQTIDIFFNLINIDPTYITTVLLDNIKISTLDLRIGETSPQEFLSTDLGSGIQDSTTNPENISSTDYAGNIEKSHITSIVNLPPIVLNKISSSTVSLFNNTTNEIDLTNWYLDLGSTNILINNSILPLNFLNINYEIGSTKIILFDNLNQVIDLTYFLISDNSIWQRQSDGLGPWILANGPILVNLYSRLTESKITMTISGLGDTSINMDYTINYISNNLEQQIAGNIDKNTIDNNNSTSRDFYLGSCSRGTCVPSNIDVGSTFSVKFSNLPIKTFVF